MSEALAALLGGIAGALFTGLIGLYATRADRRNQARAASMILVDAMIVIAEAMHKAVADKDWWPSDLPLDAWEAQRDALARGGVPGRHFHVLAGTFSMIGRLEKRRVAGESFDVELVKSLCEGLEGASDFAFTRGMRYRERAVVGLLSIAERLRIPGVRKVLVWYLRATPVEWS